MRNLALKSWRLLRRIFVGLALLLAGWLFSLIVDVQFALGFLSGWFAKQGFDQISDFLVQLMSL
jgi:hypothetical protein